MKNDKKGMFRKNNNRVFFGMSVAVVCFMLFAGAGTAKIALINFSKYD